MSEEKLTDDQIIKSLELCIEFMQCREEDFFELHCKQCYYHKATNCGLSQAIDALNLINRLKEENRISNQHLKIGRKQYAEIQAKNEALQMDKEQLESDNFNLNMNLEHITKEYEELKAENERLKKERENLYSQCGKSCDLLKQAHKETAEKILNELVGHTFEDDGWTWTVSKEDIQWLAEKFGVEIKE